MDGGGGLFLTNASADSFLFATGETETILAKLSS